VYICYWSTVVLARRLSASSLITVLEMQRRCCFQFPSRIRSSRSAIITYADTAVKSQDAAHREARRPWFTLGVSRLTNRARLRLWKWALWARILANAGGVWLATDAQPAVKSGVGVAWNVAANGYRWRRW